MRNYLNVTERPKSYLNNQGTYLEVQFKSFQDFYTARSTKFSDKTLQDLIYDMNVRSFSERTTPLNYYTKMSGNNARCSHKTRKYFAGTSFRGLRMCYGGREFMSKLLCD